jgi:AraC family transcriptional regulator
MEITIVDITERQAAAILHVGPYALIGAAFDSLRAWAQANANYVTGPPLALYPDDPQTTPPTDLRSYAAVPVGPDAPPDPTRAVERIRLSGGRYAVVAHHGSYAGLGQAWQEFMTAVTADGLSPDWSRPCFEVYVSEPGSVPDDELVTELHQPIT